MWELATCKNESSKQTGGSVSPENMLTVTAASELAQYAVQLAVISW